uniref:DUF6443 domain-containing protein n=1 Tax=Mucilaginibacter sp. TaxID=1882438 RepID=UPI0035BC1744
MKSKNRGKIKFSLFLVFVMVRGLAFSQNYVSQGLMTGTPASGEYYHISSVTITPTFNFSSTPGSSLHLFIDPGCYPLNLNLSQGQNYVLTMASKVPGVYSIGDLMAKNNTCEVSQKIQYMDGLGRESQSILVRGSSLGNDVIQANKYDLYGRQPVQYLPFVISGSGGNDGSYKINPETALINFYNPVGATGAQLPGGIAHISDPIKGTLFESSDFGRVLEQGDAGSPWQLSTTGISGSGHTDKTSYGVNSSNEVLLWSVNTAGNGANNSAYYTSGQLKSTQFTDENGYITIEFKNKSDLLICRKVQNSSSPVSYLSTYYIYDDLNNLTYVIPPIPTSEAYPSSFLEADPLFEKYFFGYHFDYRNRVIGKKTPGRGWENLVYNNLDQVVAVQDANQFAQNQWLFNKYDAQGRIIITGLWNNGGVSISQNSLQSLINNNFSTYYWENYSGGYSNLAWPVANVVTTLSINYYDSYDNVPGLPAIYSAPVNATLNMTKGLLVASKKNVLGTNNMLWTIHYYDELGHVLQTYQQHYLGGTLTDFNYDLTTNTYNFDEAISSIVRIHFVKDGSLSASKLIVKTSLNQFYDGLGRKTKTVEQINQEPPVVLNSRVYNEIGQLIKKKLHSINNGLSFLQTLDFRYNSRGWLTNINNAALINDNGLTNEDTNDLFGLDVNYENAASNLAQFNGNVSGIKWKVAPTTSFSPPLLGYDFRYDSMNRLKESVSLTNGVKDGNYSEFLNYDNLGNVLSIGRYAPTASGAKNQIDSLIYSYNGNQQTRIDDYTNNSLGFNDAIKTGAEYTYDTNGNQNKDLNKGISNVGYNLLNLPQNINIGAGVLTYVYQADGKKLRKQFSSGNSLSEYVDGIEYRQGVLSSIATEEGRARYDGSRYVYEYDLQDNQGNTRVTVTSDPVDPYQLTPKIIQIDSYYPYGFNMPNQGYVYGTKNNYLYNHKEFQDETNLYDYGARFYDAATARWTTPDPMADKMRRWTTYNYAFDNPVKYTDPDGMIPSPFAVLWDWMYRKFTSNTTSSFIQAAAANGVFQSGGGITRVGRIYENAVLNSLAEPKNNTKFNVPNPGLGRRSVIPDKVGDSGFKVVTFTDGEKEKVMFPNSSFTEVKFKASVSLTDPNNPGQLKGMIDVLSNMKGGYVNGKWNSEIKASDYGAAILTIVTPSNSKIGADLIDYATSKNVKLYQRT